MAEVLVTFSGETRRNDDVTAAWIGAKMREQERDQQEICGYVRVEGSGINLPPLAVGACRGSGGGGGGRAPNAAEREVLDLFHARHLDHMTFSPGELQSFVKQAMRL